MPRHPPNALIALDPKPLKRHAQRQVPAPFALRFGHSALSASLTAGILDVMKRHHLRYEDDRRHAVAKRPRLRPATLSYPRCQRSRQTCDRCRATPVHRSQFAIPSNSPNSVLLRLLLVGGADRTRTGDPLLAKQVLSQLSYIPNIAILVGLPGVEPGTSRLSSARSSQLS